MRLPHSIHDRMQLLLLGLVYTVLIVDTDDRAVCGHNDNVHAIDIAELFLLSERCTCHAALLVKLVEEVLEGNGCKRLALTLYFDMFFGLDRLMQAVGVTAPRHDTSCKLIYNQYLIVFYHIILIAEHEIVRPQR